VHCAVVFFGLIPLGVTGISYASMCLCAIITLHAQSADILLSGRKPEPSAWAVPFRAIPLPWMGHIYIPFCKLSGEVHARVVYGKQIQKGLLCPALLHIRASCIREQVAKLAVLGSCRP
jgi:hypothetical protein